MQLTPCYQYADSPVMVNLTAPGLVNTSPLPFNALLSPVTPFTLKS